MGIHDDSMKLLKIMYDRPDQSYVLTREKYSSLPTKEQLYLKSCINYLKELGFIKNYMTCVGYPISYNITAAGIQQIELVSEQNNSVSNTVTIHGNVSGIVGGSVINSTINQGASLTEFQSLIEQVITDKAELLEIKALLEPLSQLMEMGAPLEKGILSGLSEHLSKYNGIYTSLLTIIGTYLSK